MRTKPPYWLDARGEKVFLEEMSTMYLYHTLRLVWNNLYGDKYLWGDTEYFRRVNPRIYPESYLLEMESSMYDELYCRAKPRWMEIDLIQFNELRTKQLLGVKNE